MTTSSNVAQIVDAGLCPPDIAGTFVLDRPRDCTLTITGAILFAACFVSSFNLEIATMNTASDRLIELFQQLGAVVPQSAASQDDLLRIREYITHSAQPNLLDNWFWDFLTGILRADSYDGKIIHVLGAKDFIKEQENIEELPADSGFVQFAYWTGDSDGDAWVFDSKYRCIRCVSASMMTPDSAMAEIRARSYGVFFNYNAFPSFLRGVSHDRKAQGDI